MDPQMDLFVIKRDERGMSCDSQESGSTSVDENSTDLSADGLTTIEMNANEKLLLAECWRHLHVGQWEFFRALLLTFIEEIKGRLGKDSVAQIVRVVYDSPELFCKGSLHIGKPQAIFRLCAQLYAETCDDEKEAKILLSDADFRYALSDLSEIYPESSSVIKELYFAFNKYRVRNHSSSAQLSSEGKQFLINILRNSPKHGTTLLGQLLHLAESIESSNYLCLLLCLYEALNQQVAVFEVSVNRFSSIEDDGLEENRQAFYCLLQEFEVFSVLYFERSAECDSNLPLQGDQNNETLRDDVDQLIIRIWQLCDRGILKRNSVFFSVMSFKEPYLLCRFFHLENEFKNRHMQTNVTVSAENFLRLIHDRNGQLNIKELCLYAILNKVHFLECILVNCVHLIGCGEYIFTCRFLQDPILCKLKPLVFLLAWSKLKTIPEVEGLCELYDRLYSSFIEGTDPFLNAVCKQLVRKADLVRWALKKSSSVSKNRDKRARNAVDILKHLHKLSDLNVVHQCTSLEEVDRTHLFSVLEGHNNEEETLSKSIFKIDREDLGDLSLQELRDRMLLRSFFILRDASFVVLNGTQLEQMLTYPQINKSPSDLISTPPNANEFYDTHITKPLQIIHIELGKLYPLAFRVEILENLFSFLFLSHQNINDSWFDPSLDGSDEGYEGDDKWNEPGVGKDGSVRKNSKKKYRRKTSREDHNSSENTSSLSPGSFGTKLSNVGFLMNDLVIRDFLQCIKQSLLDASVAFSEIKGKEKYNGIEFKLQRAIASSVSFDSLSKHLSRLSQYISEAQWRFQLVAEDWIPKESGAFPSSSMLKKKNTCAAPPLHLYKCASDDDDSAGPSNSKDIDYDDDDRAKELSAASTRKETYLKTTPRRFQRRKSLKSPSKLVESKSIIYKMLSSHDSLLNYCLHNNSILKADQVIKISEMEHTLKAMEVEFALGYDKAVAKLQKISPFPNSKGKTIQRQTSSSSPVSAWDSIMKAAHSARFANETVVIDELLASYQVPLIPEVDLADLKPILINWLPEQIDWRALVRADLALVGCIRMSAAQNLLQSSYLAFRSSESPKTGRRFKFRDFKAHGIGAYIREMLSVVTKLYPDEESKHEKLVNYPFGEGVRGFLLQGQKPLTFKHHKKMIDIFNGLNSCLSHLYRLLKMENSILFSPKLNAEEDKNSQSDVINFPNDKQNSLQQIQLSYNRLSKCVTAARNIILENRFARKEEKWDVNTSKRAPAYLSTFFDYAKHLNSVLPNFESDNVIGSGSIFDVLQRSPCAIIQHLLFDKKVSPNKLEELAARLNVDLVQIIIEYCCPFIPVDTQLELANQTVLEDAKSQSSKDVILDHCDMENLRETKHWKCISSELLDYVQDKCGLLSVLIRAMTSSSKTFSDSENSESSHCDIAIFHPVLYRYLNKRLTGDIDKDSLYGLSSFVPVNVVTKLLKDFMESHHWIEALDYLYSWECQNPRVKPSLKNFRDLVFCHEAATQNSKFHPWTYALQIEDAQKKIDIILENYTKWTAYGALVALNACIVDEVNPNIISCIKQVEICQSIVQQQPPKKLLDLDQFIDWRFIHSELIQPVSQVEFLKCLFDAEKYELISQCSECYLLTADSQKIVADSRILALIQVSVLDQLTLHMALDSCTEVQQRFSICLKTLDRICEHFNNAYDLLSILEKEEFEDTDAEAFKNFVRNKIGVKIFLTLREDERSDYINFVKYPHIMIEHLLIDIKIETLQTAFKEIREDLKMFPDDDLLSMSAINHILEIYAAKAVDFRVVKTFVYENGVDLADRIGKSKAFIIPNYVPTKNQWVPDATALECMICTVERFSMFNRRHHCRRCGRVVCGPCSQRKVVVNGYGDVAVRVCDECFEREAGSDYADACTVGTPDSLDKRLKERFTSVRATQPLSTLVDSSKSNAVDLDFKKNNFIAKLSLDELHNLTIREEFSYEQAPNVPLYLTIYDLHWDTHKAANDHLQLAGTLLKYLQPVSPGVPNPEIDYNLIINMLKSVLLNAKVKFSKSFDNTGVMSCDNYFSLADLFQLLVSANCKHLIPGGNLNDTETIRKLREMLIKEERWDLALEVSTKGGLDGTMGVWAAWGMVCLRAGYYSSAREKFSHFLKPMIKMSKTSLQSCSLLRQILECLENLSVVSDENMAVVGLSLARLKNIRIGNFQTSTNVYTDGKLHPKIMSECLFYLNSYGNHSMNLSFLVKYDEWDAALKYVVDKKCSTGTFVEEILMSSLRKGFFSELLNKLLKFDPTLDIWNSYLLASCRYLQSCNLSHVLYELQIFLQDYVRAAMTCISFYHAGARNYIDLHDRIPNLNQARKHLESYSQLRQDKNASKSHNLYLSVEDFQRYQRGIDLQIEITEFLFERADRWLSLSNNSLISFGSCSDLSVVSTRSFNEALTTAEIPNVFGNSKSRTHLILMIIMSGYNIEDGFSLAMKIMEEYRLNSTSVYSLIMKRLVQNQRIADISKVINCMKTLANVGNVVADKVILYAVRTAVTQGHIGKDFDPLIKLITDEMNKIEAYIICGKLKSAYLSAVKDDKVDCVKRIYEEAERIGQTSVKDLCNKWLNLRQKRLAKTRK